MKYLNFNQLKMKSKGLMLLPTFILLAFPASTNYQLGSYEFGAGGGVLESQNFKAEGIAGQSGTGEMSSTNYDAQAGLVYEQMTATPPAPTLVNNANWYNKLLLTVDPTGNEASDTTFAIAISDDNFQTTRYIQNDNTIGDTLGIEDFQTYAQWGGSGGEFIIGLDPNKTYNVKVKSRQGLYTESSFGQEASAATSPLILSFDIDVSDSDQETAAPYALAIGDVNIGSVTTASDKVWVDLDTNAENGGYVFVTSSNGGLSSNVVGHTIPSTTANLASESEGYGLRVDTASSLTAQSPYDATGDTVGIVNSTIRELFSSDNAPVTAGRGSILFKVKTSNTTPSANDYADIITLIASGTF